MKHYVSGMSMKQKDECSSILSASVFGQPTEQEFNVPSDSNKPSQENNIEAVTIVPRVENSTSSNK